MPPPRSYRVLQARAKELGLNARRSAAELRLDVRRFRRRRPVGAARRAAGAAPRPAARASRGGVAKKRGQRGARTKRRSAGAPAERVERSEGEGPLEHLAPFRRPEDQWAVQWVFPEQHFQSHAPDVPQALEVRGRAVRCAALLYWFDRAAVGPDVLDRWRDYYGHVRFETKAAARRSLVTVLVWADALPADNDVGRRLRYVAAQVAAAPKQFDVASICLALAQNGQMCDVQKEEGIRAVYANMLGTAADESQAASLQAQVLRLLASLREALSDEQAARYLKARYVACNTHLIVPIRNAYAHLAGVAKVNDTHGNYYLAKYLQSSPALMRSAAPVLFKEFLQLYTPARAVRAVGAALNEQPRKIGYDTAVNWFQANCPQGADPHEWLEGFVFNEEGHFTAPALRFMLARLDIVARR
eukprot:TRINITY_DN55083_c0_g1_i1.p1 TRINITY_DN55083_c0_g1~~TRINITY_DN55083_c0_g1_i1.p1  ORF type:complete len:442 (+),score=148.83 TRINITY_DN55083_c0_g1_i1:80-1327(+)